MPSTADREPTRTPDAAAWASLLLLAALILVAQPLPWSLLAAAPAVGAVLLGIVAVRSRWRVGARAAALWASLGIWFASLILVDVGAQALFYAPLTEYSACHRTASTDLAEGVCRDRLVDRVGSAAANVIGG